MSSEGEHKNFVQDFIITLCMYFQHYCDFVFVYNLQNNQMRILAVAVLIWASAPDE